MSVPNIRKTLALWLRFFLAIPLLCSLFERQVTANGSVLPIKDSRNAANQKSNHKTPPATAVPITSVQLPREDVSDRPPLIEAILRGDLVLAQDLLAKQNVDAKTLETAFVLAACGGHTAVLEALLAKSADVYAKKEVVGEALSCAAIQRHTTTVRTLLDKGTDPNLRDPRGVPILLTAAAGGQVEVVRHLLKLGADPNGKSPSGWTALRAAVFNGHSDVVKMLLDAGADLAEKGSKNGLALLLLATERGQETIVRALLDKGADANVRVSDGDAVVRNGDTALIRAATNGHLGIAQALLDHGADVDVQNSIGYTALFLAAARGHEAIVHMLLERGADIGQRDLEGLTALEAATLANHIAIERLLLARETAGKIRKDETVSLVYFLLDGKTCILKRWTPANDSPSLSVPLAKCPDWVVLDDERHAVVLKTGDTIQEIVLAPSVLPKAPIALPFTRGLSKRDIFRPSVSPGSELARPGEKAKSEEGDYIGFTRLTSVWFLKDGRLAVAYEWQTPRQGDAKTGNPTARYLYAFENNSWTLVEEKPCELDDIGRCFSTPLSGTFSWAKELTIWHPSLALNPLVVARGLAGWNDKEFVLDKRVEDVPHKQLQPQWRYITFKFKDKQSILIYDVHGSQHSSEPSTYTIFLRTSKDRKPVKLTEDQNQTAIKGKYMLVWESGKGLRLIDLETGEQPIKGLKFAFWIK